jgi:5-hydroxyisourate hydrolase
MCIMHGNGGLLAGDRRRDRRAFRVRLADGLKRSEEARLAGVTTHILDVSLGRPAQGVRVELYELGSGSERKLVAGLATNADGRTDKPLISADHARAGRFELLFHVGDYFRGQRAQLADPPFLDIVPIRFGVADRDAHYHVPLLVSPWSYSTYRGS